MSEDTQVEQVEEAVVATEEKVGVKSKKKNGEVGDVIADTAKEVENLDKTKALSLAASLSENIEANYFKLGGVLKVISDSSWWEGFESFDAFVFEKFGFQGRKARYLMQIYDDLVTKQIPWAKVHHLGWTKLKDLAPILTLENLDMWVAKAEGVTVLELQAMLKAKGESGGEEKTSDEIVTLKFKFKSDQAVTVQHALAKAKGECGTEYDTVALENISALYLSGNAGSVAPASLADVMKAAGWEAVLTVFEELFPSINLTIEDPNATE